MINMKKLIILVIIILIIAFLFPKKCGKSAGVFIEETQVRTCSCLGYKYGNYQATLLNLNQAYTSVCYGVPHNFECKQYGENKNIPSDCK
jgi:hypothetical protein